MARLTALLGWVGLALTHQAGLAQTPTQLWEADNGPGGEGDPYFEATLGFEQSDEAAAIVETWLAHQRLRAGDRLQSLSVLVGDVDIVTQIRDGGAWRTIREDRTSDPAAEITYSPTFANAYVLTGRFSGTDRGFYELVLRDEGEVGWVSMYFPLGDNGRASPRTSDAIETIACSVLFGSAALPCAR